MAVVDAGTAADRWAGSAAVAQPRFVEGVQSTTKDPTALAIAQSQKLQANFIQSVQSGRWARGLQRSGKAGWQAATVAKANNYSTGIAASKDKYAQAIGPVLQVMGQLQTQVQAMPKGNIQDSVARATAWMTGLHNWKLQR